MSDKDFYSIEDDPKGIVWKKTDSSKVYKYLPYCSEHMIPLHSESVLDEDLECPRDGNLFTLKFNLQAYRKFVEEIVSDGNLETYKIIRLDNRGSVVLARESNKSNPEYFIESKLSDTNKGLELMVQVGKRDKSSKKVQLFVNLPAERMSFDKSSKDMHPSGLFTEINATFKDSKTEIKGL